MAPIFLDLSKREKLSEIQPPLEFFDWRLYVSLFTFYNSQTKISGEKDWIRLINLHLTPYHLSEEENRELRTQQAQYVCKKVIKNNNSKKWKLAIVGMDMNDAPGLSFNFIKLT